MVFFTKEHFAHIAPLFVDVFIYRHGDHYVSKNQRKASVRFALVDDITTEQILCIENGRYHGYIKFYMVVPPNYNMRRRGL